MKMNTDLKTESKLNAICNMNKSDPVETRDDSSPVGAIGSEVLR